MRRSSGATSRLFPMLLLASLAVGCGGDEDHLPLEELMKPEACMGCHPTHYREWSGSMHAYAADDPVFLAMNRRGQTDTSGELGDFCVQCHAPMALRLGLTTDGLNLGEVPQWAKGVTCFFCHSVSSVEGEHNNPLVLASDGVMRGGISNVASGAGHASAYSPLVDTDRQESSALCGACHDIVTPAGVHLERTFAEWQTTIFADPDPRKHLACGQCHMFTTPDVIADLPGAPLRIRREHTFAGVDVALTPWPEKEAQLAAIKRDLDGVLAPRLCVTPADGGQIEVTLDNIGAGHMFPSGASHDRRAWVEVIGYGAGDTVLYSSGVVAADQDPDDLVASDADLWRIYDDVFDAADNPVKFFWQVARYESNLLPPAVTTDPNDPNFYHAVTKTFPVPGLLAQLQRVTMRVLIRPVPLALIDELGPELDPALKQEIPTLELGGTVLQWTPETAVGGCVLP